MPKKKKKRKSKAEKRLEKQRRESRIVFPIFDENAMREDFCEIVETVWDIMLEAGVVLSDDLDTHTAICQFCVLGWNISVAHNSIADAMQYIDRINPNLNDESGISSTIVKTVVEMKDDFCPEYQNIIDDATVLMKGGKPVINVRFDIKAYEKLAPNFPRPDDFIDKYALDIALEGVPEDQLEDTLSAAIKAQTDDYNNTPQAELGGLTPNEAFHRNRKK